MSITRAPFTNKFCIGILSLLLLIGCGHGQNQIERHLRCALDRGPCDALGVQIKAALPEIIGRNCESCNRQQLGFARKIATFISKRYPEAWAELVQKYS